MSSSSVYRVGHEFSITVPARKIGQLVARHNLTIKAALRRGSFLIWRQHVALQQLTAAGAEHQEPV